MLIGSSLVFVSESGRPEKDLRLGEPDLSGYNYGAISSLVLTTDRSALPRRDKEPDGASTSLAGRIDPKEMGSRVQRAAPKDIEKKKKKAGDAGRHDALEKAASSKRRTEAGFGFADNISRFFLLVLLTVLT